jgi:hypothetical protein
MSPLPFVACLILACGTAAGVEILHESQAANQGVGVNPLAEQTWRSPVMTWPGRITDADRVWVGADFFTAEYGRPCVFTRDWVSEFGYSRDADYRLEGGTMVFTTGAKGFTFGFGGIPDDLARPSVRLGAAWGPCRKDHLRLSMGIEQDTEETAWEFSLSRFTRHNEAPARFLVRGKGRQEAAFDVGLVRTLGAATGFSLRCTTPGASVRLGSLRLAPSSANVHFRRSVDLARRPMLARISFLANSLESFDLFVNGKRVDGGTRIYPAGKLRHVEIAPLLVAGRNIIAFRRECVMWSQSTPDLLLEGVAVDGEGMLTRILGDQEWRCALNAPVGWESDGFDDIAWARPRLSPYAIALANGTAIATGLEPRHMGMLDAVPDGRQYPVFGPGEQPAFLLRLPVGVQGRLMPRLDVRRDGGEAVAETVAAGEAVAAGGLVEFRFRPTVREAGPYRLDWTLCDRSGQVVESRREEMVLAGPIAQEVLPLASFEADLAGRLEPVRRIDCSRESGGDGEFIDHSGMYGTPSTGKGRVVRTEAVAWRETGSGAYDYFAYRLHLPESARGEPHLVEVVVPDNRLRYVYSCVVETFPLPFCNNPWPLGSRGWMGASGACLTGGRWYPLSQGTKSLRYIYHPGSLTAAVVVMSGLANAPAAATAINIYRIRGGLPALAVPPSARSFGSHNERVSVTALSTASENPLELDAGIRRSGHRDAWRNWYRAIERKIRWLRFQGQNMSVEGVFMYAEGDVPSLAHNHSVGNQDFDLPHLLLRMYASNGIRCLLGFEYCNSPEMEAKGEGTVSDRRMWLGEAGVHAVDRHGRQLVGSFVSDGVNFLVPAVEKRLLGTLGEIRDRYRNLGAAGVFLVTGDWWAPGFVHGNYRDLDATEVGYDDLTCSRFERDTGLDLGVEAGDPQRFQKRYDRLMGAHRELWLHWRGEKVLDSVQRLGERIRDGDNPWELFLYPSTDNWPRSPFLDHASTRADRDGCLATYLGAQGLPLESYVGRKDLRLVTPLHEVDYFIKRRQDDATLPWHGWNTNPGTREVLRRLDTLYMSTQLNEVDLPAAAATKWIWSHTARGVFVLRGAGDNAMHHFVNAMRDHTPRTTFYSWIDCNLDTAFGEQQRRFAKAYYATPEADFAALPADRALGVVAQAAPRRGGCWLRLVNASPHPLSGTIRGGACRDQVYDRDLVADPQGGCRMDLAPNDIRIIAAEAGQELISCRFAFPEAVSAGLRQRAAQVIGQPRLLRSMPGDLVARLFTGLKAEDDYLIHDTLADFEVASRLERVDAELQALGLQAKLLEDLARLGSARIDCAGLSEATDLQGRRWLPDQTWLDCGAYGNQGASFADRGSLPIAGTTAERIYQTEAYGSRVIYRIPVPAGTYHVHLHLAETYAPIQRAGVRLFSVRVEDHLWERKVDPFAAAGGFAKAVVLSERQVNASDGLIEIELLGGVGLQGIEIEVVPR